MRLDILDSHQMRFLFFIIHPHLIQFFFHIFINHPHHRFTHSLVHSIHVHSTILGHHTIDKRYMYAVIRCVNNQQIIRIRSVCDTIFHCIAKIQLTVLLHIVIFQFNIIEYNRHLGIERCISSMPCKQFERFSRIFLITKPFEIHGIFDQYG